MDSDDYLHPASQVSYNDAIEIINYVSQTANPTAALKFNRMQVGGLPAVVTKRILPVQSAGNSGPFSSIVDTYPWLLTVGSSVSDKRIRAKIKLKDGQELNGESAYQPDNLSNSVPSDLSASHPEDRGSKNMQRGTKLSKEIAFLTPHSPRIVSSSKIPSGDNGIGYAGGGDGAGSGSGGRYGAGKGSGGGYAP
ncbi:uncharacterized protein A4U43_C10F3870 [Asparagus officinalis]|uniref:Uncharacterized protein n=1 Tax=Asparagus officinalis TaxID=4686 RepID=A0A5P1E0H0_ASPOF|nr:uncharacterized protein A4U43_C10F3870 [Asparagus officinalis]